LCFVFFRFFAEIVSGGRARFRDGVLPLLDEGHFPLASPGLAIADQVSHSDRIVTNTSTQTQTQTQKKKNVVLALGPQPVEALLDLAASCLAREAAARPQFVHLVGPLENIRGHQPHNNNNNSDVGGSDSANGSYHSSPLG
jgi:hypothetical protein